MCIYIYIYTYYIYIHHLCLPSPLSKRRAKRDSTPALCFWGGATCLTLLDEYGMICFKRCL